MNISNILNPYINVKYKNFHKRICQTNYEIMGIKIPILRKIAKQLLNKYSYEEILNNLDNLYYEHIMLQGLVIANSNTNYEEKLILIKKFLPKIDNWAICDIFCSELKFINKYKNNFLEYIQPLLKKDSEYEVRFAIVILIDYYINDNYIDFVLKKILEIKSNYYYVKMACAWCISICLIKYFDKTINFLNTNKNILDSWVFNKALQKGIESYRISKENKELLKKMKR